MAMNLVRLTVFCEVARQGTLSGAARALTYTTSAVSQQIAGLEREIGAPLLERLPRGIRLTEFGSVLLGYAERMLAEQRAAVAAIERVTSARGERLRTGSFAEAGVALLPQALAQFQRRFGDIRLTLCEGSPESLIAMLLAGDLDLALVYDVPGVELGTDPDLELVLLRSDPLRVLLPGRHPLAARPVIRAAEIAGENWIWRVGQEADLELMRRAAPDAGTWSPDVLRVDDLLGVFGLVAAELGIAVVSSLVLPGLRPGLVARPLAEASLHRRVYVAVRRESAKSQPILDMCRLLRFAAREIGGCETTDSDEPPRPRLAG